MRLRCRLGQPLLPRRRLPDTKAVSVVGLSGQRHVFQTRKFRKNRRDLVRAGQTKPRTTIRGKRGDVATIKFDRAGIWNEFADKLADARALLAAGQSRVQVAKKLGVSRASLYREIPA